MNRFLFNYAADIGDTARMSAEAAVVSVRFSAAAGANAVQASQTQQAVIAVVAESYTQMNIFYEMMQASRVQFELLAASVNMALRAHEVTLQHHSNAFAARVQELDLSNRELFNMQHVNAQPGGAVADELRNSASQSMSSSAPAVLVPDASALPFAFDPSDFI